MVHFRLNVVKILIKKGLEVLGSNYKDKTQENAFFRFQ